MPNTRRSKNLSDETRASICRKYNNGKSASMIAGELELPRTTVNSVLKIYKDNARIECIKSKSRRPKIITDEIKAFIVDKINEDVSITLNALRLCIINTYFTSLSIATIDRAISSFNYSFKRVQNVPLARNSENVKNRRYDQWRK